nr:immunoglobulin heavy chain junction region [Mus musculus]MBK4189350.1 immunoglobulin heavy chain junction region [Mus musculus]MBK4189351.1 immunoglobulin heavy chain junction region [Mus musculus]
CARGAYYDYDEGGYAMDYW